METTIKRLGDHDDTNLDYDVVALLNQINDQLNGRGFVLVVVEKTGDKTGDIRQYSNGDMESQYQLLKMTTQRTAEMLQQPDGVKH